MLSSIPHDPALPVTGEVEVSLPASRLWGIFADVSGWPTWNPCIWAARVRGGSLSEGASLQWVFNPIRQWYPYKLPALARIVRCEPGRRVVWEVSLPGFHAFHEYAIEPVSDTSCRFSSWEVAEGPAYRSMRGFWLEHFRFVCAASLDGAASLADRGVRLLSFGAATPDRSPLVVVPGIDGSISSVVPIVWRLATSRRVYVVDYRAEANPSLEALCDEVGRMLTERFGDTSVDLMGQSIGCAIIAGVAARSGGSIRRVVCVAPFTRLSSPRLRLANVMARLSPRPLYHATAPLLMAVVCGPVGDGWGHPFFASAAKSDRDGVIKRTAWQIGRDFGSDLAAISQPGLALIGSKDRFVPNARREEVKLREVFAGRPVEVETIPGAGHVILPTAAIAYTADRVERALA